MFAGILPFSRGKLEIAPTSIESIWSGEICRRGSSAAIWLAQRRDAFVLVGPAISPRFSNE
jgi:hypothetical protein